MKGLWRSTANRLYKKKRRRKKVLQFQLETYTLSLIFYSNYAPAYRESLLSESIARAKDCAESIEVSKVVGCDIDIETQKKGEEIIANPKFGTASIDVD